MIKDIRSIILCKGEISNIDITKKFFVHQPCIDKYTIFGDYDSLSVYKIDSDENFLINIRDNNTKVRSKVADDCVIHSNNVVLPEFFGYDENEITTFWNDSKAYFGYTAIWLNLNEQHELYSSNTVKNIKNVLSTIEGLLYKSTEHAGYVFFWKTNDISLSSRTIENLSQIKEIGDYETVISINDKYDEDTSVFTPISKVSVDIFGSKRLYNDELINKVIKIFDENIDIEKMNTNLIGQGVSQFVFHDICFEQLKEYALLLKNENIRSFKNQSTLYTNCKLYTVGLPYTCKHKASCADLCIIHEKYTKLLERYNEVLPKLDMYDEGVKSLGQLINFLLNLSFNCRYTFLCLLLYSSIIYILDTIEEISMCPGNVEQLVNKETYFLHRILRGCWTLIENINNQSMINCSQNLYNPIFYQMNIGLLEYYNGFFKMVLCYLDEVDGNDDNKNAQKISCLIVPQICRRIKTYINEDPEYDNFLFVDIPIDMISEPSITIKSLVHEISHQWGDVFRCREKRVKRFLECVANEISYRLGIWNNKVIDVIFSLLNNAASDLSKRSSDMSAVSYIDELAEMTLARIKNYASNPDFLTELMVTYFRDIKAVIDRTTEKKISDVQNRHIKMLSCDVYEEIITDLYIFFRECYADLFLIFLLDISLDEYLEIVKYEIKNDKYEYIGMEMLVQRFVFVILALPKDKQKSIENLSSDSIFAMKIKKLYNYLDKAFSKEKIPITDSDKEFFANCYNYDTSRLIVEYLKECWQKMECDSKEDRKNEIKDMFKCAVSKEIYSEKYFDYLNNTYDYIIKHQLE